MSKNLLLTTAIIFLLAAIAWSAEDSKPYFRQPAISADGETIAFVYAGDIYLVPSSGGVANLVVSHEAYDSNPRFSPDGKWLAFTSSRTGGGDVYILPLTGGEVKQLTFHSSGDQVEGFSPDGKWVIFSSGRHSIRGHADVYKVSIEGGTPVPICADPFEVEYNSAVSPDGKTMAFNSNDRVRQWWRKGPVVNDATEIWLRGTGAGDTDYRQFTTFAGKDSWPMWAPDGTGIYFVSDEEGEENIWFQTLNGQRRRETGFSDGRVLWPDIAREEGSIVFERNFGIWILRPGSDPEPVAIEVIADERENPVQEKTFTTEVSEYALSPDNKKVAFVIHGEVFAAPATKKEDEPTPGAFRITATPAKERCLSWSTDSNKLLYTSDRAGNSDLYIYDFVKKEEKRLTDTPQPEFHPVTSPDGKWCAYYRGMEEIRLINMEDLRDQPFISGNFLSEELYGAPCFSWSPDSTWLAYFSFDDKFFRNLHAKKVGESEAIQLTFLPNISGYYPIWSADGRFIVFTTNQYRAENQIFRVDLLPIEPKFQEDDFEKLFEEPEGAGNQEANAKKNNQEDEKKELIVEIITEGIKDRLSRLAPFTRHSLVVGLSPDNKQIMFTNSASGRLTLWAADADPGESRNARKLLESSRGIGSIQFAKDSKTFWLLEGGNIKSMPLKGGSAKPYALKAEMEIDFHAEKLQVFREAWVKLRDHFYDETFNGLDWAETYDRYLPYIKGARNNFDVSNIINLMVGELNASHLGSSYFSGRGEQTGDLGLAFDPEEYSDSGSFKVSDVMPNGPVAREKSDLAAGSYLLEVDGIALIRQANLNEILGRKVGKRVTLTYSADPSGAEKKTLAVKPITPGQVDGLRYRRWVRDKAAYVERISDGRLGYVHIPNMGSGALEQFKLDLDTQVHDKEGVVIDVRYNTGGYVAPFVIDVLQRKTTMINRIRGKGRTSASNLAGNRILDKPTVMVQNEQSLSNAEMFAEGYRRLGLGKIVGTASNGWVIWTWGTRLLNGSSLRLPRVAVLTLDGEDLDEAARQPDVFVDRPLGQDLTGKDDQLDTAVRVLLDQIDEGR